MTPDDIEREQAPAEPGQPEPDRAADVEASDHDADEPEWVRRRRLDAVFGDSAHGQALGDRWYRDQVPPHHG